MEKTYNAVSKRIFAAGLIIVLFAVSFAGLAGCGLEKSPDYQIVETEYFRFAIRREDGYCIALELTGLGKEQEILAVPAYIENMPVKQIGWDKDFIWYGISSLNLKKLYVPYTVELVVSSSIWSNFEQFEIILLRILQEEDFGDNPSDLNMYYYYNYIESPNFGYFWFDSITEGSLYIDPVEPTREGYIFTGWYLEPECITDWDGTKPASENEEVRVYAGWQEN